jgi:ADP-ribose pyrophosphatase
MIPWKTLSKKIVLTRGKFLTVEDHKIEFPDGKIIEDWPWVITPDFINLLAVTADQKFICLKHPKYAIDGITLAPVGGYMEKDEEPLAAAKRELLEETGYVANEWIDLGTFVVDSNRGCGKGFLFFAKNAVKVSEPTEIDMENPEIIFLTKDELISAILNGEFKVLSYALTISLALTKL